jgi:hypothetical protein
MGSYWESRIGALVNELMAIAALILFVASPGFAQQGPGSTPIDKFNVSFNVGPLAVALQMTNPFPQPDGTVGGTFHLEALDHTQTPPVIVILDAVGQAADPATLFGGFLVAAFVVEQDLATGMTFAAAVADAQVKTGVTIIARSKQSEAKANLKAIFTAQASVESCVLASGASVSPALQGPVQAILTALQTSLANSGGLPSLCCSSP